MHEIKNDTVYTVSHNTPMIFIFLCALNWKHQLDLATVADHCKIYVCKYCTEEVKVQLVGMTRLIPDGRSHFIRAIACNERFLNHILPHKCSCDEWKC